MNKFFQSLGTSFYQGSTEIEPEKQIQEKKRRRLKLLGRSLSGFPCEVFNFLIKFSV